jgi:hypothetical protein
MPPTNIPRFALGWRSGLAVRQFNQVTQSSPALMYATIAMVAIYAVIVVVFASKAAHKD